MTQPTPSEVLAARKAAGLTQTQAANLIYTTMRTWQRYEYGELPFPPAEWELFCIKTKNKLA